MEETKQVQVHPLVNRRRKRDRLKGLMGVWLHILAPSMSMAYLFFLLYKSAKKNKPAISQLFFVSIYMFFFAKKNKSYIKFVQKFDPTKYFRKWEIIVEEEPDKTGVLFPVHPHSIMPVSIYFNINRKHSPFKGAHLLGSREAISIPPLSLFYRLWGVEGVNPENFDELMKQRENICFVPGGFEEATITSHKEYRIYIIERKGFIKYALQYGYKIHPVFVFNENKMYKTSDFLMNFRLKMNEYKIPSTIFYSKYLLLPDDNIDIITVVGKAIQIPKIENPSRELVERYHEIYIHHLKDLFYRNVDKYDPGARLVIYGEDALPQKPKL